MTTKKKVVAAIVVVGIIAAIIYYFKHKGDKVKKQRQPLTVAEQLAKQQQYRPQYDKTKPISISNRPGANLPT